MSDEMRDHLRGLVGDLGKVSDADRIVDELAGIKRMLERIARAAERQATPAARPKPTAKPKPRRPRVPAAPTPITSALKHTPTDRDRARARAILRRKGAIRG